MQANRIVIVGGGFAGVWAAMGAAAAVQRASAQHVVSLTLVSPDGALIVKPRLYESDHSGVRVPLGPVLDALGVEQCRATVSAIDVSERRLTLALDGEHGKQLGYDQLVLCAGSETRAAPYATGVHLVDSYERGHALQAAVADLHDAVDARFTATVVGAGFTGLEVACELAVGLRTAAITAGAAPAEVPVHLIDQASTVAPEFGPRARVVIEWALRSLGVAMHCGVAVSEAHARGVSLANGEHIEADLTVWSAGPRASALYEHLGLPLDASGRVAADEHLATAVDRVWVAGDGANVVAYGPDYAPMSCQHAIPQGRQAGANAVAQALGRPLGRYRQPLYLTCLDLGPAGALLTEGFERDRILAVGAQAKAFKRYINRSLIYPPGADRAALLKAGRSAPAGPALAAIQRRVLASALIRRGLIASAGDRAGRMP
jgi:NADH dehydrogenase